jgi:glycosyltransferase involved in cell wall biosynthesis
MELKSVTVIIPTVNRPKLIKRCIDSVLSQDYEGSINCIVVDSSENTKTRDLCETFLLNLSKTENRNIEYIYNKDSKFPIDNWIIGSKKISTNYAKFLCDDDWLSSNFISECIYHLDKNNSETIVTNINIHQTNGNVEQDYYSLKDGLMLQDEVIDSFINRSSILPVTPTATLMVSSKFIESFKFSLEHWECTKHLFGFDFLMNYYGSFDNSNTFILKKALANSWAGEDSMTLNVKKSNISYCYLLALGRLVYKFEHELSSQQKKLFSHYLGIIKLKSIFQPELKKRLIEFPINKKIIVIKLINDFIAKSLIKIKYKFKNY